MMDTIRCPMCGKENPADLSVCQFCQARIKPLTGPISEDPAQAGSSDDWLGSLRSEGDLAGDEEGDWSDDSAAERLGDEFRDPLDRLSALDAAPPERGLKEPEPEYEPDDEPVDDQFAAESNAEKIDLSAWLASLDESDSGTESLPPAEKGELPDWLKEQRDKPQIPEPAVEDDTPEWLAGLSAGTGGFHTEVEAESSDAENLEFTGDTTEVDEDLPDWLRTPGEEDLSSLVEPSEEPQAIEAELPDWMAEIGLEEPVSEASTGEEEPVEELPAARLESDQASELPAWPSDEDLETSLAAESDAGAGDLPQWLMEAAVVESIDGSQPAEEKPDEFPDWLSALEEGDTPEITGETALEPGDLPEWLRESQPPEFAAMGLVGAALASDQAESEEPPAGEMPGDAEGEISQASELEAIEIPDWLVDLQPAEDQIDELAEMPDLESMATSPPAEDMDDWLATLASEVGASQDEVQHDDDKSGALAAAAAAAALLPFALDSDLGDEISDVDLGQEPDWLADVKKDTTADKLESAEEDGIVRADLPEWLAAMRPVDAVMSPKTPSEQPTGEVENAGPLVGLQDVLPAEADILKISKPESISVRLDVNEAQQRHISLLEQMLKQEVKVPPAAPVGRAISERLFRWVVFAVLILSALFGILTGTGQAELPISAPEAQDVYSTINSLLPQAQVLVAFDYEPGLAGEMETISTALLDHLMLRGVYLTLVSTTTTGPIQAENVIQSLNAKYTYERDSQYVNLGYIPGGSTGLQSLANFPMRLLLPYTFSGYEPWDPRLLPLANVEKFSDFAMILVLTDRQETGRAWIEQIGPRTGTTKFLLGTSAQIEPLIRPYYGGDANLVDGFIAGLSGSGSYESMVGEAGLGSQYWDTYQILVLVAAGLILIGGLVNWLTSLPGRKQPSAKGEQTNEPA